MKKWTKKNSRDVALHWKNGCWYATYRVPVMDPTKGRITVQRNRRTSTTNGLEATKMGNKWRDEERLAFRSGGKAGENSSFVPLRDNGPTCGQVLDLYLNLSKVGNKKRLVEFFVIAVAEGLGWDPETSEKAVRELRVSRLTDEMMRAFRRQDYRNVHLKIDPRTGKLNKRNNVTVNTIMRGAKSIFTDEAMVEFYGRLTLPVQQINAWKGVKFLEVNKQALRYRAPTFDVWASMDGSTGIMLRLARWHAAAGRSMKANQWRNAYACYRIMRTWGLRNDEAVQLHWDFFAVRADGSLWLELVERPEYWDGPKGIDRKLPIETAGLYEELVALFGPRVPGPEGFVLAGTMTDRIEGCNRRINTFVRRFMKGTQKGAYNLRKQFGSEMIANPEIGLELGSALLGHAQVSTTQDHYYDQLKLGKMRPLG